MKTTNGKLRNITSGILHTKVQDVYSFFEEYLLKALASAIIVAHNHPSGQLKPSRADERLTTKIVKAGKCLEIEVLDHIILTYDSYYSFADNELI